MTLIDDAAALMGEVETLYFGISPYGIIDQIGEVIVGEYASTQQQFVASLRQQCPFLSNLQVDAIADAWYSLVEQAIDRNFELFEAYVLKNVLSLPPGFLPDILSPPSQDASNYEVVRQGLLKELKDNRKLRHDFVVLENLEASVQSTDMALQAISTALDGCFESSSSSLYSSSDSGSGAGGFAEGVRKLRSNLQRLKDVVRDTLDVTTHLRHLASPNNNVTDDSTMATDLYASLLDDGTQSVSDARLELQCLQELQRCTAWAPTADIQHVLQMISAN